ncbi:MAG: type II secretion system protein [Planctomycetota bacterium]|jgi:hypothetical protein
MKIKRKNGFTLIELLVLLSILMPALNAVKKQAQRVVCMANQSQWGLILTLYTEDHDSRFFAGYYNYTDPNGVAHSSSNSDLWPYALESYYVRVLTPPIYTMLHKSRRMRETCPAATA